MSNTIETSIPEVKTDSLNIDIPQEPAKDDYSFNDEEPISSEKQSQAVLTALGIDDLERNMPDDDKSNLTEVKQYVAGIIDKKGLDHTQLNYKKVINDLRFEMGLDFDASPEMVLDRIGGVVKAWKDMSFISDPREKRALFMKLARLPDSKSMNKVVYEAMENYKVWQ